MKKMINKQKENLASKGPRERRKLRGDVSSRHRDSRREESTTCSRVREFPPRRRRKLNSGQFITTGRRIQTALAEVRSHSGTAPGLLGGEACGEDVYRSRAQRNVIDAGNLARASVLRLTMRPAIKQLRGPRRGRTVEWETEEDESGSLLPEAERGEPRMRDVCARTMSARGAQRTARFVRLRLVRPRTNNA